MGITALKSLITFGQRPPIGNTSENPDVCPAILWGGVGYFDGRSGYNATRLGGLGWYGSPVCVIDQVPSTIVATNIAASNSVVAGTPMTLVSTTGAGITVLAAALQVWPSGNTVPKGSLAIDGAPGLVGFGTVLPSTGVTRMSGYDPTKAISRNVRITTNADDSLGFYNVAGYDLYGYPMTEKIAGVSSGVAAGAKAWKFITSITPSGTVASTAATVGTGDVYGLPIYASRFQQLINVTWNSAVVTAATGFVAGVTTSPATNLTGDVRGTYAIQTAASNNTLRLTIFMLPAVANCNTVTGLFGVTQA